MGIKDLNSFLRKKCPNVFEEVHLSEFQYKKCAVDISLFIFKYKTIFGDENWLSAIINLVCCMKRNQIHACFIYDTSAPEEKQKERQERREKRDKLDSRISDLEKAFEKAKNTGEFDQILIDLVGSKGKSLLTKTPKINLAQVEEEIDRIKRQSVHLTQKDFDDTKQILELLGVPYFQAKMEAETTCADLCKQGQVDAVISEDTDVLAYGCPVFLTKINTSTDTCILINYDKVLENLGLSSVQFLDFCIMCGTDYNKNIFKIGPEKAYKLIKQYNTIEEIGGSGIDISCLNHKRVRELFLGYEKHTDKIPYCKSIDFNEFHKFLFTNNIRFSIEKVKKDFAPPKIVFED